jgi:NTE family protein
MSRGSVKPPVAIACQGGGSHTAFTAGVLGRLLEEDIDIRALSGTSGGAICALLAWNGIVSGRSERGRSLRAFWRDNAASSPFDRAVNGAVVGATRFLGQVMTPEISPYLFPEIARHKLTELLERHAELGELERRAADESNPMLLISAIDVLSGEFMTFRGGGPPPAYPGWGRLSLDALLASAAVPSLFRAVRSGGRLYWDGLFSQNPPIRELLDAAPRPPEELWIVQINPQKRASEPRLAADIRDRRNELTGNLSLGQEVEFVFKVNEMRARGLLSEKGRQKYRRIGVRRIAVADEVAKELDYESKLDRDSSFIERLMEHGQKQAERFLRDPDAHGW